MLAQLKKEKRQKGSSLRADSLTIAEERNCERDIKLLAEQIEKVQKFIDSNVGEKMADVSVLRNDIDSSKKQHDDHYSRFSQEKANVESIKEKIDDLKESRTANQQKIIDAKEKKTNNLQTFNKLCEAYEKDRAVYAKLRSIIAFKKVQETENNYNADYERRQLEQESKKTRAEKERDRRQEAERKEKEDKQAEQERQALEAQEQASAILEERKRKAKEAYEAQQKQLAKLANRKATPVTKTFSKPSEAKPTEANDPNCEAKRQINSLIDMFKGMQNQNNSTNNSPTGRRKKKRKNKKTFKLTVDIYSKLTSFGVKVPKKTTDFDDTIKSLQDKLNSFDNENEDVKESVDDQPVAVQNTEETV